MRNFDSSVNENAGSKNAGYENVRIEMRNSNSSQNIYAVN